MESHKKTKPGAQRSERKAMRNTENNERPVSGKVVATYQVPNAFSTPEAPEGSARAAEAADGFQFPRWKRALDLTCITLALPCWLPLMFLVALGILLVSPGPILYRQERIGYRGRRFRCLKFRSMKTNAETRIHERYLEHLMHSDRPMTKLDAGGDPRLIPFGQILRATGLDELPQIFNVLRGEMSLVGPRPCTPAEFANYGVWQRRRIHAPPGLTGYWQVNGKNETTFSEMIAMDIHYAGHMSLGMDLWIMFKTIPAIIRQVVGSRMAPSTDGTKQNCS